MTNNKSGIKSEPAILKVAITAGILWIFASFFSFYVKIKSALPSIEKSRNAENQKKIDKQTKILKEKFQIQSYTEEELQNLDFSQ